MMASTIALGAVAGFAQDPCLDADGQTKMSDSFRELYPKTTIEDKKATISAGKSFLEKYGACDSAKEFSDYLKTAIPTLEKALAARIERERWAAILTKFDQGLDSKNWDDVYASGKQILSEKPEDFRGVELVLGSIGYDELLDRQNSKYSEDTLKYAKQSLADLEAGKEFKPSLGVKQFKYNSKEHATAWMNLTIGTIYQIGQKNKVAAFPYLYKATQGPAGTDISKIPNPYEFIGLYYFDELNKITDEIKVLAADQKDTDTPEVAKQKVDAIKAKVAMSNGTAERAMDAFSRAYTIGVAPAYKAKMKKNVEGAYNVRFGKLDGMDAWIAETMKKPFVNPATTITPISDPEPVATPATTTPGNTTAPMTTTPAKPATTVTTPSKAPVTPPVKKPAQSMVKKPVAKKKVG